MQALHAQLGVREEEVPAAELDKAMAEAPTSGSAEAASAAAEAVRKRPDALWEELDNTDESDEQALAKIAIRLKQGPRPFNPY